MGKTGKGTGLQIHHDIRNEKFLLRDVLPLRAAKAVPLAEPLPAIGPVEFKPRTRRHRQYTYFDQGSTPKCTGYGSATLMAAANPYNKPPFSADEWYDRNVAFDRAHGRHYDGGATVVAALEVGRQAGLYSEYRWAYTIRTMQEAILHAPMVAGVLWYDAMYKRDTEGICGVPADHEKCESGHFIVIRGYDHKRDLWRCPNTWGDGDYLINGDLMFRLAREGGEFAQTTELKVKRK